MRESQMQQSELRLALFSLAAAGAGSSAAPPPEAGTGAPLDCWQHQLKCSGLLIPFRDAKANRRCIGAAMISVYGRGRCQERDNRSTG